MKHEYGPHKERTVFFSKNALRAIGIGGLGLATVATIQIHRHRSIGDRVVARPGSLDSEQLEEIGNDIDIRPITDKDRFDEAYIGEGDTVDDLPTNPGIVHSIDVVKYPNIEPSKHIKRGSSFLNRWLPRQ